MPLLETLAIAVGPAIAKNLLKSWLGEGMGTDILGSLADLLAVKSKDAVERSQLARQMNQIGETVTRRLEPFYKTEFSYLSSADRAVVVHEVAATLETAQINAELLIKSNLDSAWLSSYLHQIRPDAFHDLSADQAAMYELLLKELGKSILEYADQFSGFDRLLAARILEDNRQIIDKLDVLLAAPSKESVRYEQDYRAAIKEKLDRFELFGIPNRDDLIRRQSLVDAYVVLNVVRTQFPPKMLEKGLRNHPEEEAENVSKEQSLLPADQLLSVSRRIVIRGDGGFGKSTLLKWFAVQIANKNIPTVKDVVPLYIRLREFVDKDLPDNEALPKLWFKAGVKPNHWVHELLDSGRALLLIDGMDELPARQRPAVLDKLKDLVLSYPLAHYIVASRPPALKTDQWPEWQEWTVANHFMDVTLQEMDETQVGIFIHNWFRALQNTFSYPHEPEELEKYPENMLLLLKRRPPLRRLAANPLLCAMLCALYHDRQQSLPSNRITLYDECIQMLLTRREEVRGIHLGKDYPDLEDSQKIGLIQSFAYWLMKNGYSDAEKEEVDDYFEKLRPSFGISDTSGVMIRRFYVERANLLREPVEDRIDFMHRTLQEYLAARSAVDLDEIGLLVKNSHDDQWREVIILAAGVANKKQREKLIDRILNRANELKRRDNSRYLKLLALACLETRVELSPELRGRIIQNAAQFIPPCDVEEAQMLAKAGDPAVPLLANYPHQSRDEASACQYALTQIGSEAALAALEQYADKPDLCNETVLSEGLTFFDLASFGNRILSKLRTFNIQESASFEGWNFLTRVSSLQVSDPSFHDAQPLASLTQLESLDISYTQVSDLTPLASLTQLESLDISNTQVSDLTPLANLTRLETLYISDTQVSDLVPLANLTRLKHISIVNTQVNDLSPLINLPNLHNILFTYDQLLSMKGWQGFQKTKIQINIKLPDIADYKTRHFDFPDNVSLRLIERNIETFSSLSDLNHLQALYCFNSRRFNSTSDLTPLASLTRLEIMYISDTQVSDLTPLANLTQLKTLNIANSEVSDLTPLANLTQLKTLNIANSDVSDLTPLANLTHLETLKILYTQVSDLTPLANLTQLETLDIANTQVSDLTPLAKLTCLKRLDITGLVVDVTPVGHILDLQINRHFSAF